MTYTIDSASLRKDQTVDNRYHLKVEWSAHGRHAVFSKVLDCSEDHINWARKDDFIPTTIRRLAPEFFSTVELECRRAME